MQLRSWPLRLRRDLVPLAARLQEEERADATWSASPVGGLTPRLTSGDGDSSIAPDRFVELLVEHLRTAPPAWDPYAARSVTPAVAPFGQGRLRPNWSWLETQSPAMIALESEVSPARTTAAQISANFLTLPLP